MFLSEFDIVYVTQKAIKEQALADHLAENPVDEEYEPLKTYLTMKKCHLWVRIFLKCIQVEDYSLMERRIIKVKVLEQYYCQNLVNTIPWPNTKLVFLV